jgi:hypothetical protein
MKLPRARIRARSLRKTNTKTHKPRASTNARTGPPGAIRRPFYFAPRGVGCAA